MEQEMSLRIRSTKKGFRYDLGPADGCHPDAWGCDTAAEALSHLRDGERVVSVTADARVPGIVIRKAQSLVK